jgi:hypothetical protein
MLREGNPLPGPTQGKREDSGAGLRKLLTLLRIFFDGLMLSIKRGFELLGTFG